MSTVTNAAATPINPRRLERRAPLPCVPAQGAAVPVSTCPGGADGRPGCEPIDGDDPIGIGMGMNGPVCDAVGI